jgi:hypothetical protein
MFRAFGVLSMVAVLAVTSSAQDVFFFNNQKIGGGGAVMTLPVPAPDEAISAAQKALTLNETQVTGLKALLNIRAQTTKTAFEELAEKQKALGTILNQQNPSALDIGNAYLGVQSGQNALKSAEQKFQTDFKALLTADQRTILQNLQTASSQIEALRILGVIAGVQPTFDLPITAGIGPFGGPIGVERSIRIFRKDEQPTR